MKRLVILILVLSAIFTLGCSGRDLSGMDDAEILKNVNEYDLYGTWTPVGDGEKLTLSQNGARYGDKSGRWSYGENGVRVQIEGEGAFYLAVTVKDKKIRLELDGKLFVKGETVSAHLLTLDNFWDFFELKEIDAWSENEGATWFSREYAIALKEEYSHFYAENVEIKAELKKVYYDYATDYENKSFSLIGKDESYNDESVNSRGNIKNGRLVLHSAFLKEGESFSFAACENVKITSVSGTLYTV